MGRMITMSMEDGSTIIKGCNVIENYFTMAQDPTNLKVVSDFKHKLRMNPTLDGYILRTDSEEIATVKGLVDAYHDMVRDAESGNLKRYMAYISVM
jgi:hypothetical protein